MPQSLSSPSSPSTVSALASGSDCPSRAALIALIEEGWDRRDTLTPGETGVLPEAVRKVLKDLDEGTLRVASPTQEPFAPSSAPTHSPDSSNSSDLSNSSSHARKWVTHEWIKKAILLSFRLSSNKILTSPCIGYDKVPSKFEHWTAAEFEAAQIRVVPGAHVRAGTYLAPGCVIMPSFINLGAYIGQGTMIDIGAQVGSCAQIGAQCHLSANAVIGGVIEPLQASPVIVEDHCFVGAQCALVEGLRVGEGAVLGMGTHLGASTPILDRTTGDITYGYVPPYTVVVPGVMPSKHFGVSLACAVIVKRVDKQTRLKTAINTLLRP